MKKKSANFSCYKNFLCCLAKAILLPFMFLVMFLSSANAQDYMINRGVFASSYSGGLRLCVVDKNEYYQPYTASGKCAVRQYKNGIVSQYGTTAAMPPAGVYDIAYDSVNKVLYVGFTSSDYDSIYTYKRSATDPDWVLAASQPKPASNLLGYTLRMSFNINGGKLFMAFSEVTSQKVYLYELVSGTWTNRTGATAMLCNNNRFDLVSYGNKVITTTTPYISSRYKLRVHVYDITTSSITTLPDWDNGTSSSSTFASTAYNVSANEYIAFLGINPGGTGGFKALRSSAGGAWSDISTGFSGIVDNGGWDCQIVFNNMMSRYTAFGSSGSSIKGFSWDGTSWSSLTMPYMRSSSIYAVSNYKDAYFLAWDSNTNVGIFTPNETPIRNTMNISANPSTTSSPLTFPARGVGNKVAVFIKSGAYVAPVTADGTTYTANTTFGSGTQLGSSGWYCIYNGIGQTVTVAGLTSGTTYQVQALEYNGDAGTPNTQMYIGNATVTGNPISFGTPLLVVTTTDISSITTTTAAGGGNVTDPGVPQVEAVPSALTGTSDIYNDGCSIGGLAGLRDGNYNLGIGSWVSSAYIIVDLGSLKTIADMKMAPLGSCGWGDNKLNDALVYASPDNSTYTLIGTVTGMVSGQLLSAGLPSFTARYVKLQNYHLAIGEWRFYQPGPVSARGIVWNTSGGPSLSFYNGMTNDGTAAGAYTSSLTGLTPNTTYYVKAYATNSIGTCYGSQVSFTTPAPITNIWTGTTSTNWNTIGNWSTNTVPLADDNAIVPSVGITNFPEVNEVTATPAVCNNLTIQTGATVTIAAGKALTVNGVLTNNAGITGLVVQSTSDASTGTGALINGTAGVLGTVQRWMSGDLWHLISPAATAGETVASFVDLANNNLVARNGNNYALAPWLESTGKWDYYKVSGSNTSGLFGSPAQGYQVMRATGAGTGKGTGGGSGKLTFKGTLAAANFNVAVTKSQYGWNLIGNPYPCGLDVEKFITANAALLDPSYQFIYVSNMVDVATNVYTPVTTGLKMAPGEGFFVRTKAGGVTVNFTTAMKSNVSDAFKAATIENPTIRLTVEDGNGKFGTTVQYIGGATKGLDPGKDAGLFNGTASSFRLFTRLIEDNGVDFTVQALPDNNLESMVVPVGLVADKCAKVTFKASAANLPAGYKVVLEDKETATFTRLDETNSSYTVSLAAAILGTGRFYLHTTEIVSAIDESLLSEVKVVPIPEQNLVRIVGNFDLPAKAMVYDMNGKLVATSMLTSQIENDIPLSNCSTGVYMLKVESGKGVETVKFLWKRK